MSKLRCYVVEIIKKHMLTCLLLLVAFIWCGYRFYYNRAFPEYTGEYVPYVLGQVIDFTENGNSKNFIKETDGWGNQEQKYRCTVKKDIFTRLYVKNEGQAVKFSVYASGSFPAPDLYQRVIVSINGKNYTHWDVSFKDWYDVIIPASMIQENKLEVRFYVTKPYVIKGDTRELGMIVEKIKLKRVYGQQTRLKLRNWLAKQVKKMSGELSQEELEQFQVPGSN